MSLRRRRAVHTLMFSPATRPLRFAGTGSVAGAIQILLLAVLNKQGWDVFFANGLAFLAAAQVNFALSVTITWRDRLKPGSLVARWLVFHGSIALMALVNMVAFALARPLMPILAASLTGIGAAALGNYLIGDRLVFRRKQLGSAIQWAR